MDIADRLGKTILPIQLGLYLTGRAGDSLESGTVVLLFTPPLPKENTLGEATLILVCEKRLETAQKYNALRKASNYTNDKFLGHLFSSPLPELSILDAEMVLKHSLEKRMSPAPVLPMQADI